MYGYAIKVSQIVDDIRKPKGEGYYRVGKDNKVYYSDGKPFLSSTLDVNGFEELIYNECYMFINKFSKTADNKDIYCFTLSTSEHNDIIIYINNLEKYHSTLKRYISMYPKYKEDSEARSLKYSLGDFEFMYTNHDSCFSNNFRTIFGEYMNIANGIRDEEIIKEKQSIFNTIKTAYSGDLFDDSLYSILKNVLDRLVLSFDLLNKTNDFIYYLSTGDDYIDYSLSMRKTVQESLFYRVFPDMKNKDLEFELVMKKFNGMQPNEMFESLYTEVQKDNYRIGKDIFSKYVKTEYEAVKYLAIKLDNSDIFNIVDGLIGRINSDNDFNDMVSRMFILNKVLLSRVSIEPLSSDIISNYYSKFEAHRHIDNAIEFILQDIKDLLLHI